MNIYVDFDDCLCETARYFSKLLAEMFGKNVPYEEINYFNLQESFSLTDEDYDRMMTWAHKPEELLSIEETPGAVSTVNSWIDEGHDVSVITGRPLFAYEASRKWLDQHGLERVKLYCLDKYGRKNFIKDSTFSLQLEDYYKMDGGIITVNTETAEALDIDTSIFADMGTLVEVETTED